MRVKRLLGKGIGYSLLLVAALVGLYGITTPIVLGVNSTSFFLTLVSLGLAFLSATFGIYVLKVTTGTVFPLDVDTDRWRSVLFRGGQGP